MGPPVTLLDRGGITGVERGAVTRPSAGGGDVAEVDENGDYVRRPTPVVAFLDESGTLFPLATPVRRAAHLLVFLSPGCGPCGRILPQVPGWAEELAPVTVKAVLVSHGAY